MTYRLRLVLLLAVTLFQSVGRAEECYPGVYCWSTAPSASKTLVGPEIAGLSEFDQFVVDSGRRIIWARDIYSLGITKELFAESYAGRQSRSAAMEAVKRKAKTVDLGGVKGWRVATSNEVDQLLESIPIGTLYSTFRRHQIPGGARNVIGLADAADTRRLVAIGVQHANTLHGPYRESGFEYNEYGVWLVRGGQPDDEAIIDSLIGHGHPLREIFEPTTEVVLSPIRELEPSRRPGAFGFEQVHPGVGQVRSNQSEEVRYVAEFNLRPIPEGEFVGAGLVIHGASSSNQPVPTIEIFCAPSIADETAETVWRLRDAISVGVWRFPNSATLEVPSQLAGNAFRGKGALYVAFRTEFGDSSMMTPRLRVVYVDHEALLTSRFD